MIKTEFHPKSLKEDIMDFWTAVARRKLITFNSSNRFMH